MSESIAHTTRSSVPAPGPEAPARAIAGGRYRIGRFLGRGASKQVFLAEDTALGREVAISFVGRVASDAAQLRYQREVRAMARLGDHPNVVSIHDVGTEDGMTYIVAQYVRGGLARRPDADAPAPPHGRGPGARRRARRGRRAGARPRARRRPPRRQARQRAARRGRHRAAHRLRRRAHARRPAAHRRAPARRDRAVHAARAGARRGARPAQRPLRARRDAVRAAVRRAAVPRQRRGRRSSRSTPARRGRASPPATRRSRRRSTRSSPS